MSGSFPVWLAPILGSALMLGLYDVCKKHAVRANAVMPVLFFSTLCGSGAFVLFVLLSGHGAEVWQIGLRWRLLVLFKSLLVGAGWGCVYRGLRDLPISIASPLRATGPVWTFLGSLVFFAEIPTWSQGAGMAAIFGGYCLFSVIGKREGFSWRHPGVMLTVAGTILGGASALYDKFLLATVGIPPRTVQFHFALDLVVVLGSAYALSSAFRPASARRRFEWRWSIAATGLLLIVADALYFYAVSLPEIKISILSLLRRSSVVVAFLVGGGMFRELQLRRKAAALALILLGVALLALAG